MKKRTGTYSRIFLHFVFAVQNRHALLDSSWEESLYKYITGTVQGKNQLLIAINGHRDHIHILVSIKPVCVISELVREIKKSSTNFINSRHLCRKHFTWQEGYGVFSCDHRKIENVVNYIKRQKEHHQKFSFKNEYLELLDESDIEYNPEYLFEWIDSDETLVLPENV